MVITLVILVILGLLIVLERFRPEFVLNLEENILAIILATMAVVSFIQVIARYGFNTGWGGALEFTTILFAWMILFGMSYGVKMGSHLGVDAAIRLFPKPLFKAAALFGAMAALLYAVILLSADWLQFFGAETKGGAIAYWSKFFKLGIGLDDLRYPEWIQSQFGIQERVQRWVAYLILPIGLSLFAFRCLQAIGQIWTGKRELIVAGHEAEDLVAENKNLLRD
ncbi:MAG: TRAP transporter small permease [Rhodospirillales bacterium]|nr:TRAP transporter small permease [Rhodospirillales bacterium]MCW8861684.1 TRAP transporter small permease [Rhodospirillales bacterium]MCW8951884.1 TRAP transporter small permease [Rhodospirillales bacterium]MCW8971317.1 TRAP transporter small permease [Rhodospirillales bacterium]MCW9001372.1 TRAP transporter small permease [Rhodospirillales bacterium]